MIVSIKSDIMKGQEMSALGYIGRKVHIYVCSRDRVGYQNLDIKISLS